MLRAQSELGDIHNQSGYRLSALDWASTWNSNDDDKKATMTSMSHRGLSQSYRLGDHRVPVFRISIIMLLAMHTICTIVDL